MHALCEHQKRRTRCVLCGGGSVCYHDKRKASCSVCYERTMRDIDRKLHVSALMSHLQPHSNGEKQSKPRATLVNPLDETGSSPSVKLPTQMPFEDESEYNSIRAKLFERVTHRYELQVVSSYVACAANNASERLVVAFPIEQLA